MSVAGQLATLNKSCRADCECAVQLVVADYIQSELQLKAGRDKGDLHELDGKLFGHCLNITQKSRMKPDYSDAKAAKRLVQASTKLSFNSFRLVASLLRVSETQEHLPLCRLSEDGSRHSFQS